ncbi:hypothetical protein A2473_03465 [candidate division WWE3 bacterium RIFOXYC2_FULL_42_13]|uniref:Uncharacterized protein n=1 Tax=candidate division WWE3 bacterium TaxID=2053526 RepID=A0A3D0ZSC2_UNCKA|nr:MAG: hypothetical protein US30_C0026G0002 [Candidatus Moranbacteria bacterium GW2011_GWF2_36_839]OGC59345.1 MAG: hypothetical protein A2245_01570 [candidate division WWE3 bacterium RIFOXYA2_FULL_43_12]OGC65630.1 MAG: hypothetical protein A2274_02810 [candidate division WWE3 bacterium RIFOXYA12_FULL_43_11]OGC73918.1 MAG: hypothetical protein A2473_03465 [candidate division WWE3 bacterium RIFOXYC2_FULL_42_13]OGC75053.1 MAG: hypothetical protein A2547_01090 [candidate division WWE3 bacterium RI
MNRTLLESGVVPFVVLKPYASERCGLSIYDIRNQMFEPNERNVQNLISFLNEFVVGSTTGTLSVDSKFYTEFAPERKKLIVLEATQHKAESSHCNVLGALFLEFLESFGYSPVRPSLKAIVAEDDEEFLKILYPVFDGYFTSPSTVENEQLEYLRGVQQNNTGLYSIFGVNSRSEPLVAKLTKVAYLKRIFRHATKTHIPFKSGVVRDNLIHSPESVEELLAHGKLFAQRLINNE